ncbi:putative ATP synthase, F1 complex, delta/epsilon subunit [Medicago truncatula]|uniref:Putative ATP synthase, F1 complex, delta/epsilon subunit n=1 Tax=Medicago truncatula TaxID=3880 RepID=A0A396GYM0_MEDTR|nr:putative ATP synthase, F1 complex, delta/epsilon subunit [Medicago truncatula]
MTLNLCVLTPNRTVWDSEVKEIILSTNSGQIGVLKIMRLLPQL